MFGTDSTEKKTEFVANRMRSGCLASQIDANTDSPSCREDTLGRRKMMNRLKGPILWGIGVRIDLRCNVFRAYSRFCRKLTDGFDIRKTLTMAHLSQSLRSLLTTQHRRLSHTLYLSCHLMFISLHGYTIPSHNPPAAIRNCIYS